MLMAVTSQGQHRSAAVLNKTDGPFHCRMCGQDVVLKKGKKVIHHFAHSKTSDCKYGIGETEIHRLTKLEVYYELLKLGERVSSVSLEQPIADDTGKIISRADVFAFIDDAAVAFEIQHSKISPEDIYKRTQRYHANNIHVCWIVPMEKPLGDTHSPSKTERALHTLYFGNVLYWDCNTSQILPVKFAKHEQWVPVTEYYTSGCAGVAETAGGYHKTSKRLVEPIIGEALPISALGPVKRNEWKSTPAALLFTRRTPPRNQPSSSKA